MKQGMQCSGPSQFSHVCMQLKNDVKQKTQQLDQQEKHIASLGQQIKESRKGKEDSVSNISHVSLHVQIQYMRSRKLFLMRCACRRIGQQCWQRCSSLRAI